LPASSSVNPAPDTFVSQACSAAFPKPPTVNNSSTFSATNPRRDTSPTRITNVAVPKPSTVKNSFTSFSTNPGHGTSPIRAVLKPSTVTGSSASSSAGPCRALLVQVDNAAVPEPSTFNCQQSVVYSQLTSRRFTIPHAQCGHFRNLLPSTARLLRFLSNEVMTLRYPKYSVRPSRSLRIPTARLFGLSVDPPQDNSPSQSAVLGMSCKCFLVTNTGGNILIIADTSGTGNPTQIDQLASPRTSTVDKLW
jgi:hypothetical protein